MYRQLKASNLTRGLGEFVVEGEKLFDRLRTSRFPMTSVLAAEALGPSVAARIPAEIPIYVVPERMIGEVVGFNFHRGILACGQRLPWPSASEVAREAGPVATIVVCPRIDNPENLGSIVRIADVFGAAAIFVGDRCPDPLSRRVLRVSMGSSLAVPVLVLDDLENEAARLIDTFGFVGVASVIDPRAAPLKSFQRPDRVALFLGSEGHGLDAQWLKLCAESVTIPMPGGAESLNVSIAAGILLHQLTS